MEVVKDMTVETNMAAPVLVRKGRNTLGSICKEASTKKFFDNIVETFKERTVASKNNPRLANLSAN